MAEIDRRRARTDDEISSMTPAAPARSKPVRSLVLDALEDLGWPTYARELSLYTAALVDRSIPATRFGPLSVDERKAYDRSPRSRPVWLCPRPHVQPRRSHQAPMGPVGLAARDAGVRPEHRQGPAPQDDVPAVRARPRRRGARGRSRSRAAVANSGGRPRARRPRRDVPAGRVSAPRLEGSRRRPPRGPRAARRGAEGGLAARVLEHRVGSEVRLLYGAPEAVEGLAPHLREAGAGDALEHSRRRARRTQPPVRHASRHGRRAGRRAGVLPRGHRRGLSGRVRGAAVGQAAGCEAQVQPPRQRRGPPPERPRGALRLRRGTRWSSATSPTRSRGPRTRSRRTAWRGRTACWRISPRVGTSRTSSSSRSSQLSVGPRARPHRVRLAGLPRPRSPAGDVRAG